MDFFLFINALVFFILAGFLFYVEKIFAKNFIEIIGKVIGYSKGKSKGNNNFVYAVIEFHHPNGEIGWLEARGPSKFPLMKYGTEVKLQTEKNDLSLTRVKRGFEHEWGWFFLGLGLINFYLLGEAFGVGWKYILVYSMVYCGLIYLVSNKIWKDQFINIGLVPAWQGFRNQLVRNQVYSASVIKNIHFLESVELENFFKRANRHKIYLNINLTVCGLAFVGLSGFLYEDKREFYSSAKSATATIVKISHGMPVFEYHDLEGVPRKALSYSRISKNNLVVGKKFDVLFDPEKYKEIRLASVQPSYYEEILMASIGVLMMLSLISLKSSIPKFNARDILEFKQANLPEVKAS